MLKNTIEVLSFAYSIFLACVIFLFYNGVAFFMKLHIIQNRIRIVNIKNCLKTKKYTFMLCDLGL